MNYRHNHQANNKVVYLDKRRSSNSMARPLGNNQSKGSPWNGRKVAVYSLGLLCVGLALIPLFQTWYESTVTIQQYSEIKELEKEVMRENIQVQEEYQHMQDPDYLADVARRDYFYSKPGEIVFDIDDGQ